MPAARTVAAVVKDAVAGKPAEYRATVRGLRATIKALAPGVTETVNPWGLIAFEHDGPIATLLIATKHISLVFWRGTALPDPAGLLEGTGKGARHVKLRTPADVERAAVTALIKAAVALNRAEPSTAMAAAKKKPKKAVG